MSGTLETIAVVGVGLLLVNKVADSLATAVHDVKQTPAAAATVAGNAIASIPQSMRNAAGITHEQYLNAAIDEWFTMSAGYLFGLFGTYDPTDYQAFYAANRGKIFGYPNNDPPADAPPYFNVLSIEYWQNNRPGPSSSVSTTTGTFS
jgi:hypothetical protein